MINSFNAKQPLCEVGMVISLFFPVGKLRLRELRHVSKVKQLGSERARFEPMCCFQHICLFFLPFYS